MVYMILNRKIENMFDVFDNLSTIGLTEQEDPFKIEVFSKGTKKELINKIYEDLRFLSLFYSCPLYVYILSDKFYYKNFNLPYQRYCMFKRIFDVQNENLRNDNKYNSNLTISKEKRYFNGDESKLLEYLKEFINKLNLVKHPIWGFKIYQNSFYKYSKHKL